MAKKTEIDVKEEIRIIFETLGGSIDPSQDIIVSDAILKLNCVDSEKVKVLVEYAREIEREQHYSKRVIQLGVK